jgi:hypothetical protein
MMARGEHYREPTAWQRNEIVSVTWRDAKVGKPNTWLHRLNSAT